MPETEVRESGYVSRSEEFWYGLAGPFYDLLTWWCFLPLGGERRCRREFIDWYGIEPSSSVLSLCCGSGTLEMALADAYPDATIIGLDLGSGQIARANAKKGERKITFAVGDASKTDFEVDQFDRVLITLALHEMPRKLRLLVLKEAARVCKPSGRVVAVEHGTPRAGARFMRALWWFYWLPGNPEYKTTKDLQRHGLASEMKEVGLRPVENHQSRWAWIEGVVAAPG